MLPSTQRQADHRHRLFPPGTGPPASWPSRIPWARRCRLVLPSRTHRLFWVGGRGQDWARALPDPRSPNDPPWGGHAPPCSVSVIVYFTRPPAELGLRCCLRAFSSVVGGGYPRVTGHRLRTAEGRSGPSCRAQALGARVSVAAAHGLGGSESCGIVPDQGSNLHSHTGRFSPTVPPGPPPTKAPTSPLTSTLDEVKVLVRPSSADTSGPAGPWGAPEWAWHPPGQRGGLAWSPLPLPAGPFQRHLRRCSR